MRILLNSTLTAYHKIGKLNSTLIQNVSLDSKFEKFIVRKNDEFLCFQYVWIDTIGVIGKIKRTKFKSIDVVVNDEENIIIFSSSSESEITFVSSKIQAYFNLTLSRIRYFEAFNNRLKEEKPINYKLLSLKYGDYTINNGKDVTGDTFYRYKEKLIGLQQHLVCITILNRDTNVLCTLDSDSVIYFYSSIDENTAYRELIFLFKGS
ncbi:hypothetical protein HCJ70_13725 [Listeria booriae]|uniref:hypothetical protein n=1 Tax=Listeria booriae TaxID=1552123 RepID=UPI00162A357F|nr:hypothetical protein [Listeria booriae]MBC2100105.1 hypothetical protein [Listeria booriae]